MCKHFSILLTASLVMCTVINSIQGLDDGMDRTRNKRTAPLILGFVAKKFGYQLYNQNDIFGRPNEIVLRRIGYTGKPRRPRPQQQAFNQWAPLPINEPIAAVTPAPAIQPSPTPTPMASLQPQQKPFAFQMPQPFPQLPQQAMRKEFTTQQEDLQQTPQQPLPQQAMLQQMMPQQQTVQQPPPQQQGLYSPNNNADRNIFDIGTFFPFPWPFPSSSPASTTPAPAPTTTAPAPVTDAQQTETPSTMPPMPIAQTPIPVAPVQPTAKPVFPPPPATSTPQPTAPPAMIIQPQTPQLPQFPVLPQISQQPANPAPSAQPSSPQTIGNNDVDVTAFQRKAPANDPNYFGGQDQQRVDFDYTAIDPRSKNFENFQFVNSNQAPQSNLNSQQYEEIGSPSYDSDVLTKGFLQFQQQSPQNIPSSVAPVTTTTSVASDAEEGQYNFAINVPDDQQRFEAQPQQPEQEFQLNPTQTSFEVTQFPQQEQPFEQEGRNNFAKIPANARGAAARGKILNIEQLQPEFVYQAQKEQNEEFPSQRASFDGKPTSNYDVQIIKSLEFNEPQDFGARMLATTGNNYSRYYLPPTPTIQRRQTQGNGQRRSLSQMSFRSNNEHYSVQTNHQVRSQY